jgi:hypothetical protein
MTSPQPLVKVSSPLSTALPSDSFQLLSSESKVGAAEDALFNAQVQAVKDWWLSPRYAGIKRSYSPEDVVARRGTLQQVYPSSVMARKLFELLEERAEEGLPVHTSRSSFFTTRQLMQYPLSLVFASEPSAVQILTVVQWEPLTRSK